MLTFDSRHIEAMMGPHGMFEHALFTRPRREHGYCTDDNARLLVLASREEGSELCDHLGRQALDFVVAAQSIDGRFHNRLDTDGRWTDVPSTDDCWGRALWGLGVAARLHTDPSVRALAAAHFTRSALWHADSPRSMAFAALGAAEIMALPGRSTVARLLLLRTLDRIGPTISDEWFWPEERLGYANASLAEAVIAAGHALGSPADVDRGLGMLTWLLARQMRSGCLSVAPVGGSGPDDVVAGFDQQPIEVASLAEACSRALHVTGDTSWCTGIAAAVDWFDGHNDSGHEMADHRSGGCYDGLRADGVNANEGAESTLALAATRQLAAQLRVTTRR